MTEYKAVLSGSPDPNVPNHIVMVCVWDDAGLGAEKVRIDTGIPDGAKEITAVQEIAEEQLHAAGWQVGAWEGAGGDYYADVVEDTETYDAEHGYIAAVATAADGVEGDHSNVLVIEQTVHSYDNDGTPILGMSDTVVTRPVETTALITDDIEVLQDAAEKALEEAGWARVGGWEIADDALYATVERA